MNAGQSSLKLNRRALLGVAGASALSLKLGALDFAASLFADELPAAKPRIQVVFLRPEGERYWMDWPGASFDAAAKQAEYTNSLTDTAKQLGLHLDLNPVPIYEPDDVADLVAKVQKSPPDGVLCVVMHLKAWPRAQHIAENRGRLPLLAFSPLGTSLTDSFQAIRKLPQTFVAATSEPGWPGLGLRMLGCIPRMRQSRICMITDAERGDREWQPVGTTLHHVPLARWVEQFHAADETDEMREIAKHYGLAAQAIVEPNLQDLLRAAKNYVVARQIMAQERCQGISVDCARLVGERMVTCGPCMAWSKLLDEGRVGACEGDGDAAVTLLLTSLLLQRPGFMQDLAANTLKKTVVASHCTCATRLDGFDQPAQPFVLRDHFESHSGVALRVLWRQNQEITLLKFQSPDKLLLGTGRVLANIDGPEAACRTSIEIALNNVADPCDVRGHHQVIVCGKLDAPVEAYGRLAGINIQHL